MENLTLSRNAIMAQINKLQSYLEVMKLKHIQENTPVLIEESLNLLDGVGEGFVGATYYAPDRYYSRIEGIKNLRMWRDEVVVKLLDKRGYDLPETIEVRGKKYKVTFVESKNFTEEVLD